MAVFDAPVVFADNASAPKMELSAPELVFCAANAPNAEFPFAVLLFKALRPKAET